MIPPEPAERPIFNGESMHADMSIVGQMVMATATIGAAASVIKRDIDPDSLYWHCSQALEQLKLQPVAVTPEERAHVELARTRATRGLKLATAAIALLKAYDEVNRDTA